MKQRFSSLDVRAISHELKHTLVGSRLANVYDLVPPSSTSLASSASTPRAILLRFSHGQNKQQLVVDSGFRCHLTAYDARSSAAGSGSGGGGAASAPSVFVSRLRTFLNGRHVSAVSQLGSDRVIEIRFTDGRLRLFLEFFAAGNVVLTDADAKVLALQRTVAAFRSASLDVTLSVGSPYALLLAAQKKADDAPGDIPLTAAAVRIALEQETTLVAGGEADAFNGAAGGAKKKKKKSLSRILALAFADIPQVLIDHALLVEGFSSGSGGGGGGVSLQPRDILDGGAARVDSLLQVLQHARRLAGEVTSTGPLCKGYIIALRRDTKTKTGEAELGGVDARQGEEKADDTAKEKASLPAEDLDFIDYHPVKPRQFEVDAKYVILTFDSFNRAVDEFYSHLQGMKADRQMHHQESAASKKLEATKRDQATRIESLQEIQQSNARKAAAIEANQDLVQAAIDAVNEQLGLGTDWADLALLIANSADSNPVAAVVKMPMKLADGVITLRLQEEPDDEWDEEDEEDDDFNAHSDDEGNGDGTSSRSKAAVDVDVKLNLSAWSNAREYYGQKRVAAVKEQKTKEVTSLALRNAERKVAEELKRVQRGGKPAPQLIRRGYWFEKFFWFVSSDGYLVLADQDPQQSEVLYRRHLRRGDVFVHADIRGAPKIVVVKNRPDARPDDPIPPTTLAQAGCLAVCASEAWDTKAGMGAYWVHASQVFKLTAGGDVLPVGAFDIRGEKNHLPPPQRVLGFGLMFKVGDASRERHDQSLAIAGDDDGEDNEVAQERAFPETSTSDSHTEDAAKEEETGHSLDKRGHGPHRVSEEPGEIIEQVEEQAEWQAEEKGEEQAEEHAEETDERGDGEERGRTEEAESDKGELGEEKSENSEEESSHGSSKNKAVEKGKEKEHVRAKSPAPSIASSARTNGGQGASKRGQRTKAKKLAKYKDQDADDRARAEILVGIAAGREKAEAKARAKAQREAEVAAYEERRRLQRERQVKAAREFEAARQAKMAAAEARRDHNRDGDSDDGGKQGPDGLGEEEGDGLETLATLVGRAAVGDEILEAVPVCGPWAALARLKYKVKLQPGQIKKGRAMRDVLERWRRAAEGGRANSSVVDEQSQDPERIWPREAELLQGIKMEEAANCVPVSRMTLMLAGGFGGGSGSSGGAGGGGRGGGGKTAKGGSGKQVSNKALGSKGGGGGGKASKR